MDGNQRLTVRLPAEDAVLLNELVLLNEYPDLQAAVRTAVEHLLAERFTPAQRTEALRQAAVRPHVPLQRLTADGADAEKVLNEAIVSGLQRESRQ